MIRRPQSRGHHASRKTRYRAALERGAALVAMLRYQYASRAPARSTGLALGLVLVAGFALRFSAVGFGNHALTFQPDEDANIPVALSLSWRHLNPGAFYYPALSWYLLFGLNQFVHWLVAQMGVARDWSDYRAAFDFYPIPFFLVARTLSVAFGTGTIALLYLLGRRLYSPAHGLLAAGLLAGSFLHVRDSALATPDVPMTFFVVLSLLGAAGVVRYGRGRDYVLAAVGAGAATATKYNAILVLGALVVAHVARTIHQHEPIRRLVTAPGLLTGLGVVFLVFLVLDPYLVFAWPKAREGLAWQWSYSHTGQYLDLSPTWRYHFTVSLRYGMGLIMLVLATAGAAWTAWRREPGGLVLLTFAVGFFAEMSTLHAVFVRYMTPLVPVLCLLAALAILSGVARIRSSRARAWGIGVLAAVAMVQPLNSSVRYARLVHHVDTRVQAYEFLESLPGGTSAATYGPSVTWRSTLPRWTPTFYAKHDEQTWAEALRILKARGTRYFLIHHSDLDVFSPTIPELEAAIREAGTLVRVFSPYARGIEPRPVYDWVDAHYFPVGGFRGVVRPGPLVMVYRLD